MQAADPTDGAVPRAASIAPSEAAADLSGGEAGIRTLDTGFSPYNGLANRRLRPLGHLTAARRLSIRQTSSYGNTAVPQIVPEIVPSALRNGSGSGAEHVSRSANRMHRFFSPTPMPATDWRAPLYSHEAASVFLVGRASRTRSARWI
jgi:hypothetical protein